MQLRDCRTLRTLRPSMYLHYRPRLRGPTSVARSVLQLDDTRCILVVGDRISAFFASISGKLGRGQSRCSFSGRHEYREKQCERKMVWREGTQDSTIYFLALSDSGVGGRDLIGHAVTRTTALHPAPILPSKALFPCCSTPAMSLWNIML